MYKKIKKCRVCGNSDLVSILDLGRQVLTGVFPCSKNEPLTCGPLELVKCCDARKGGACGLLQLRHSYDFAELYGKNYGYRSSLNNSMVEHLRNKVERITGLFNLSKGDLIMDIGSNDGTLLKSYPDRKYLLVGVDPTGDKFKKYYPKHIRLIPDFFSADSLARHFGCRKAKVITSIAMFYDLESPLSFMEQIYRALAEDGIWVFEQSYLPAMLKMNSYDTICHEHLEYYALRQIKWMTDKAGFKIIDVELNNVNGGSFCVTVAKSNSAYREATGLINKLLCEEERSGLNTLVPYRNFSKKVFKHREKLLTFIKETKAKNKVILGYGASTKGNVILQFCKLSEKDIPFIAEVNKDKFGCFTPGTLIPIISEEEARNMKPDYFMVLPWHFKENIIHREKEFLRSGGKLFFPLPSLEIAAKIN